MHKNNFISGEHCCNNASSLFTNTKVIPVLYDGNNNFPAVTVTMTMMTEALVFCFSQKCVCPLGVLRIFTLINFESFFPKNLIQNLHGAPVSSVSISLTDSCNPQWGFRVKYHDRWQCSEAFLFTHSRGWKEQICYWQLVNVLWSFSVSSDFFLLASSSFEYVIQKRFEELLSKGTGSYSIHIYIYIGHLG